MWMPVENVNQTSVWLSCRGGWRVHVCMPMRQPTIMLSVGCCYTCRWRGSDLCAYNWILSKDTWSMGNPIRSIIERWRTGEISTSRRFVCSLVQSVWNVNLNVVFWRFGVSRQFTMNTNHLAQNFFVDGDTNASRKAIFVVSLSVESITIFSEFIQCLVRFPDRSEVRAEKSKSIAHRSPALGALTNRRWRSECVTDNRKHPTAYHFSIREHSRRTKESRFGIAHMGIVSAAADYRFDARVLRRSHCRQWWTCWFNA